MRLWIDIANPELMSAGEMMSVLQDLTELMNDTGADELMVFIGLKIQPIILPSNRGGRTAKRNIHFIGRHSIKPEIWVGSLHP
jgi:hypothetical protein